MFCDTSLKTKCFQLASPVSLRGNELTLGRDKIPVISDISFYGC